MRLPRNLITLGLGLTLLNAGLATAAEELPAPIRMVQEKGLLAAVVLAGDRFPGAARLAGVVLCLADHGGEPGTEQGLHLLEQLQVDALGLQALADLGRAGAGAGQVEQHPAAIFGVQGGEAAGVAATLASDTTGSEGRKVSEIWRQCKGERHIRPLQGRLVRLVESQEQVATLQLVDTLEEQALLEELLESSKPPVPADAEPLHYLLKTSWTVHATVPSGNLGMGVSPIFCFYDIREAIRCRAS